MRKNYYGRRRKINNFSDDNKHYKKYLELVEKANKTEDIYEKTSFLQTAEFYLKKARNED